MLYREERSFFDSLTSVNYEYTIALENAQELFDTVKLDFFDDLIDRAYALTDKIDKVSNELGIDPKATSSHSMMRC